MFKYLTAFFMFAASAVTANPVCLGLAETSVIMTQNRDMGIQKEVMAATLITSDVSPAMQAVMLAILDVVFNLKGVTPEEMSGIIFANCMSAKE